MALSAYTDAELERYINQCTSIRTTREEVVLRLSPHLVAKPVAWPEDPQDEVIALERARAVGVNVPAVRRVVPCDDDSHFIIMDYIDGQTMEQLWKSMGLLSTIRIARQLRSYLHAMATVAAPITGGLHSGRTHSEWLDALYGPVKSASPAMFTSYLNWWLTDCRPSVCEPRPDLTIQPAPQHILVHQDLVPRNLIVDRRGTLWIVDWGHAGYYPAFMEYAGMDAARGLAMSWLSAPTWAARWARARWALLRFIACGFGWRYSKQLAALRVVRQRSLRFRMAKGPYSDSEQQ
ncbi:kinase-like protein [Schizophyllum commune]